MRTSWMLPCAESASWKFDIVARCCRHNPLDLLRRTYQHLASSYDQ